MSNRITLARMEEMTTEEVSRLDIDLLHHLLEEIAALQAQAKRADTKMSAALARRFEVAAQEARRDQRLPTGRVKWEDAGYTISADLPKKVTWDEDALRRGMDVIRARGEDVEEYVVLKISVPENRWNAWPTKTRELFEAARTVGVGRASFTIAAKED